MTKLTSIKDEEIIRVVGCLRGPYIRQIMNGLRLGEDEKLKRKLERRLRRIRAIRSDCGRYFVRKDAAAQ